MGKKYRRINRVLNEVFNFLVLFFLLGFVGYFGFEEIQENEFTTSNIGILGAFFLIFFVCIMYTWQKIRIRNLVKNGMLLQGKVTECYWKRDIDNKNNGKYIVRCIYEDPNTGKRYEGVNRNCDRWYGVRIQIDQPVDVYVDTSNFNKCYVDVIGTVEKKYSKKREV